MRAGFGWMLAVMVGCADPAPTSPSRYALRVDHVDARGGERNAGWVRDAVDAALTGADRFVSPRDAGDAPVLASRLRFAQLRTSDGERVLRLELSADPPPEHRAALGRDFDATVELAREDGTIDLRRDVPVAAERAVAVLEAKLLLVEGDALAIEGLLGDDDPEIVLLSVEWVHHHRRRRHADTVVTLLGHPDPRVGLAAIDALGAIGGPDHAAPIVRAARLGDRAHAGRVYEALASVGGPHARGFLEFAARNEDDPAMAAVAKRALERVRTPDATEATPALVRGHRQP